MSLGEPYTVIQQIPSVLRVDLIMCPLMKIEGIKVYWVADCKK